MSVLLPLDALQNSDMCLAMMIMVSDFFLTGKANPPAISISTTVSGKSDVHESPLLPSFARYLVRSLALCQHCLEATARDILLLARTSATASSQSSAVLCPSSGDFCANCAARVHTCIEGRSLFAEIIGENEEQAGWCRFGRSMVRSFRRLFSARISLVILHFPDPDDAIYQKSIATGKQVQFIHVADQATKEVDSQERIDRFFSFFPLRDLRGIEGSFSHGWMDLSKMLDGRSSSLTSLDLRLQDDHPWLLHLRDSRFAGVQQQKGMAPIDSIFEVFPACQGLHSLRLYAFGQLTDQHFERLSTSCPRLRRVSMIYCDRGSTFGDRSLRALATNCRELSVFEMPGLQQTIDGAAHSTSPTEASTVGTSAIRFTPQGVLEFIQLCQRNLSEIDVSSSSSDIRLAFARALADHPPPRLRRFNLGTIDDRVFEMVLNGCPLIDNVAIQSAEVTLATIEIIGMGRHRLRRLGVANNGIMTDATVVACLATPGFAQQASQLERLMLSRSVVGDRGIAALSAICPLLRECNLIATAVTDDGLQALCHSTPLMQRFFIDRCRRVTDLSIRQIPFHWRLLRELGLSFCAVSPQVVQRVIEKCKELISITLSGRVLLPDDISRRRPQFKVHHF